jgi:hypothetical protein
VVILDLILIGLAITLDPLPLAAYFVILPSRGGVRKGAAFIFGWLLSLGIVVTVTVLIRGDQPPKPQTVPSLAALAVKIAIGVLLVGIAIRQRRRMGRPKKPKKPPKWQASVDRMSPWYAVGIAPLLQPWGLIAAGAATVVQANVANAASVLMLFLFCVLATSSYIFLEVYAGFWPDKSAALLARYRAWMDAHTDQVIIIGCLVLGFFLIVDGLYLVFS